LLAVIAAHGVLIYALLYLVTARQRHARDDPAPLLVVTLPAPSRPLQPAGVAPTRATAPHSALEAPHARHSPAPDTAGAAEPPSVSDSNAITDWSLEAQSAAQAAVARARDGDAQRRAFEHHAAPGPEAPEPGIFDPPPEHHAGEWDGDSFYVTDHCHFDFDRTARPPPTALDHSLKTAVCKPPMRGGADAMFKDLAPDYLKNRSETNAPKPSP